MNDHFRRLRSAFDAASAVRDPTEREAVLQAACAGDAAMLDEVRRLLAAELTDDFLVPPHAEYAGPPAARLGEFELLREIDGGRGAVWLAHQPSLQRQVAVKVLRAVPGTPAAWIERFHREPMHVARLGHPHIVPVFAEGRDGDTHWFAMQYVDGHGLDEEVLRQRDQRPNAAPPPLPAFGSGAWFAAVARITAEAAEALHAAHERAIVHRDVKPGNLLLDRSGNCLVADFGIARDDTLGSLTEPGTIAGTWHYMSPEQARIAETPVDHRTDIYSLGVVLYELLTLRRPFEGRTSQEVLEQIRVVVPRAIRRQNPQVPRDLETICEAAMARDVDRRYATAGALAADLRRFLQHEAILRQPPSLTSRLAQRLRRHRRTLAVGVGLLLAVAIGSLWRGQIQAAERDRTLTQDCLTLLGSTDLDKLPLALLARMEGELGADPTPGTFAAARIRLADYVQELVATGRQLLVPPTLPPVDADRAAIGRGLVKLLRASTITANAEIAASVPEDPFAPLTDIVVHDAAGAPCAAAVTMRTIDGLSGLPRSEQALGEAPMSGLRLPAGMYHFVVRTRDGVERTFVRQLEAVRRHPLTFPMRAIRSGHRGAIAIAGGNLHLPANGPPNGLAGKVVAVEPFWLDACEVTVGEFRAFLIETGRPLTFPWDRLRPEHDLLPVADVSWPDAVAYAEWAGKRLPTYPEMAIAGHGAGPNPRRFPWTDEGPHGNCSAPAPTDTTSEGMLSELLQHGRPVDADPRSCTPEGVFELFGNVSEWTASPAVREFGGQLVVDEACRICFGDAWYALTRNPDADLHLIQKPISRTRQELCCAWLSLRQEHGTMKRRTGSRLAITNRQAPPPPPQPWPERFEERAARIESTAEAFRVLVPEAKAMCTLDAMTDPAVLDAELAKNVRQLTGFLLARVVLRASFALHDLPFQPMPGQDENVRAVAENVEERFRAAMIAAFPPPVVPGVDVELHFDVRKFERTFAHFVAGDLRTGLISPVSGPDPLAADGVPDGANFFSFAEAVLLFLRLGRSPDFWLPTLRTFVAGSLFFATHYWNRGRRRLDAYTGERVTKPTPGVAASMLAMVQQFHGALDLPKLIRHYGDVLAMALRDDPSLSRPISLPRELQ